MATKPRHVAQELLSQAFPPEEAARIFIEKVKQRPLVLRPTEVSSGSDARERRRRARALQQATRRANGSKPRPLSAREKRKMSIYEIPREECKYAIYEPLHEMWVRYVQDVLGEGCTPVTASTAARLCSADFHGAELQVVRARCVGRVGLRGIVVKDTKFTFEIITEKNEIKSTSSMDLEW